MQINTEFEIKDKVSIKPFDNIEGIIEGIYCTAQGIKYYVAFWKDCSREYEYFYTEELEKRG